MTTSKTAFVGRHSIAGETGVGYGNPTNHLLICVNQCAIPTTARALSYHYPFIEESHHPVIVLYSLTLSRNEARIPTRADWLLLTKSLSVFAREAEKTLPASTFRAFSPDHTFELPFAGTGVMLDGHLKWHYPAGIATEWPEEVIIIGVAMRGNSFSSKRLQV